MPVAAHAATRRRQSGPRKSGDGGQGGGTAGAPLRRIVQLAQLQTWRHALMGPMTACAGLAPSPPGAVLPLNLQKSVLERQRQSVANLYGPWGLIWTLRRAGSLWCGSLHNRPCCSRVISVPFLHATGSPAYLGSKSTGVMAPTSWRPQIPSTRPRPLCSHCRSGRRKRRWISSADRA